MTENPLNKNINLTWDTLPHESLQFGRFVVVQNGRIVHEHLPLNPAISQHREIAGHDCLVRFVVKILVTFESIFVHIAAKYEKKKKKKRIKKIIEDE